MQTYGDQETFEVVPQPPELYDEEHFVERMIVSINVASDDFDGDGLSGHRDCDLFESTDEQREIFALSTDEKRSVITKETLARRWGIGLDTAQRTLRVMTQRGVRTFLHPTA